MAFQMVLGLAFACYHILMAYIVMTYTVMAYIVMAYTVMAFVVVAYIVMASKGARPCLRLLPPRRRLVLCSMVPHMEHDYIGHNYIGHSYIGHNCIGHNYRCHTYIGSMVAQVLSPI